MSPRQVNPLGRALIIANPAAQSGYGEVIAGRLQRFLKLYLRDLGTFDLVRTKAPGHAARIAAGAGAYDTVIALGGDGVIHEVANGLMRIVPASRPALGLVPVGSGNDYARTLGIGDWRGGHLDRLLDCGRVRMDVGRITADMGAGAAAHVEYFVQTCSFGLDAAIALGTVALRARTGMRGGLLYGASGLTQFGVRYRKFPAHASLDGRDLGRLRAILFAMQIGPTYGSGFRVCPGADPQDGLIDICYAQGPIPRAVALPVFLSARGGHHTRLPLIHMARARRIELAFERPDCPIQADGERVRASSMCVECLPAALTVLKPLRAGA